MGDDFFGSKGLLTYQIMTGEENSYVLLLDYARVTFAVRI